jgi:hypothetical protein
MKLKPNRVQEVTSGPHICCLLDAIGPPHLITDVRLENADSRQDAETPRRMR